MVIVLTVYIATRMNRTPELSEKVAVMSEDLERLLGTLDKECYGRGSSSGDLKHRGKCGRNGHSSLDRSGAR